MSLTRDWTIGTGAVGLRDTGPRCRTRPDLCADHDHPGVTFNPWHGQTWCLCGQVIRNGDAVAWPKADGHDGPLHECHTPPTPAPRKEAR